MQHLALELAALLQALNAALYYFFFRSVRPPQEISADTCGAALSHPADAGAVKRPAVRGFASLRGQARRVIPGLRRGVRRGQIRCRFGGAALLETSGLEQIAKHRANRGDDHDTEQKHWD
jgi:hypothetical protein